jgi:hypothetical protein
MTEHELHEYRELRATIRERGSARVWVMVVGIASWAAIEVAVSTVGPTPLATLVPLVVLAAAFEAIFALHAGVERIGRYLDVFHADAWESAAAAFGRPSGAIRVDPLFVGIFAVATMLNLVPALLVAPTPQELIFVGGAHALFVVRMVFARLASSKQRAIDRERFAILKAGSATTRNHEIR